MGAIGAGDGLRNQTTTTRVRVEMEKKRERESGRVIREAPSPPIRSHTKVYRCAATVIALS